MTWLFKGQEFKLEDYPWAFGFVYLITNTVTGQKYVGRKYFVSTSRIKVKDRVNRKVVKKESDWKKYYGSSKKVLEDIKKYGKENFTREILSLHETRQDVNYYEMKEQVDRDILHDFSYYNDNIVLNFYRSQKVNRSEFKD